MFAFLQSLTPETGRTIGPLINAILSDTTTHMRMAERRTANAADSARASKVVSEMRASMRQYADVAMAERDGYQKFLPWLDTQEVYHYNSAQNARDARTAFSASKPTSLLYRKDAGGKMVLVGAMFTAPAASTPEQLDARLPLGIAYWHQHINFCARRAAPDEQPASGPDSAALARSLRLETPEACAAAGGMFIPQLFGWMAHVNAFGGDDLEAIWGAEGREHMHTHSHHRHPTAAPTTPLKRRTE